MNLHERTKMIRFVASILLGVLVILVALPSTASAEPRLIVTQPTFDFGTVPQGAIVEHQFEIGNGGTGSLKIRKINPSCGCTAAVLDSDTIESGNKTFIKTSFNTAGFQGYKEKTIRIYSNDPDQTSTVLTLQGTVKPDVEVDPARLHFGNVRRGSTETLSTTILVEKGSPVSIKEVKPRSEDIEVVAEDITAGSQVGKRLTVTLKPDLKVGVFRGRIAVMTTSEKNPVLNIPVFANIEGEVQLDPTTVSFGLLEGPLNEAVEGSAELISPTSDPVKVLSVGSDHPSVSAEFSSLEEPGKYAITVKIKKSSTGVIRARVKIVTDHKDPEQRELSLPVYAIVSRAKS